MSAIIIFIYKLGIKPISCINARERELGIAKCKRERSVSAQIALFMNHGLVEMTMYTLWNLSFLLSFLSRSCRSVSLVT